MSATHCVNSWRSPIRISLRWIWLPKQFSLFSLVFLVILREETFLVLWISSVLNPVELKVASYRAASKLHYKYFSLIFNRFVTKLLFLTKASLMKWRWSIGDGEPCHENGGDDNDQHGCGGGNQLQEYPIPSLPYLRSPSPKIWLAILREQKVIDFFIFFKWGGFVWRGVGGDMVGWVYVFVCELFWISQQMFLLFFEFLTDALLFLSHGLSFNGTKEEVYPIRSRVEPFDFWLNIYIFSRRRKTLRQCGQQCAR